jgi:hypothetical protein
MNAINPITSNYSMRDIPEFKIIIFLLIPVRRESPEK